MDDLQLIFLSVAAVVVLYQTIQGWRLGLVRQIVRFGGLGGAYAAAYLGGATVVPYLRPLGYPDFVLRCIGGVCLGLATYLAVSIVSGILFKRTAQQNVGLVWFFYGVTGAALGLIFGLALVIFVADIIRLLGGMAEKSPAKTAQAVKPPAAIHQPSLIPKPPASSPKTDGVIGPKLVEMKHSLEKGVAGEILQTIDPMPKQVYVLTAKIGQLGTDPEAMTRFLTYPGAKWRRRGQAFILDVGDSRITAGV